MHDYRDAVSRDTLLEKLKQRVLVKDWRIVTAESCTGGGLAKALTELEGASAWFESGFVTYSNQAKQTLLAVQAQTLECYGAVSQQTVEEMAKGALARTQADLSVAVSGIAGPGGGTVEKPVGTVWFAWSKAKGGTDVYSCRFFGERHQVREQAIDVALQGLLRCLDGAL